jgi:hypothetical protein
MMIQTPVNPNDVEWVDVASSTNLPSGVRLRLLSQDAAAGVRNVLVSFPAGYVEPRHTHGIAHATFLLQGRWIVEGKEIGPGGYIFGPAGLPHGPFESPVGSMVNGSDLGSDYWHAHPPTAEQEAKAVPTIIVDPGEVDWQKAGDLLGFPEGVEVKIYNRSVDTGRLDGLARFPATGSRPFRLAGLSCYRNLTLLEGRWSAGGVEVGPGGHVFLPPSATHGPVHCPEGALVCFTSFPRPQVAGEARQGGSAK